MPAEARRRRIEAITERVLSLSKAEQTEVSVIGGHEALTRFADNRIHQNMSRDVLEISVRVVQDGRTGRASTTREDAEALADTAARALEIAKKLEPLDDLLPVSDPFPAYPATRGWDEATAGASPEMRARAVKTMVDEAAGRRLSAAGSLTSDDRFESVANSRGLFAYGEFTSSVLSVTMTAAGGNSGYAEAASVSLGGLDPAGLARRAAGKAERSGEDIEIAPGEYTTLLEPAAVAELLWFLVYGMSCCNFAGLALREGQSWFCGKESQQVFGENITLSDDVFDARQGGVAFDSEGVPRRALTLIDRGHLGAMTYDRAAARAAGIEPTGHGLPVPNTVGSVPQHPRLEGGSTSIEDMIRGVERGVLVTRLWYNRLVDPADLIVTGLTRDGTFLIENGAIVSGLRNYRINQSLRSMLNGVRALSPAERTAGGFITPALLVDAFRFSAVVPREPD